jgi:hypothetical protein
MLHAARPRSGSVKDCLSNLVGPSAFFLIAVAILASACKQAPSKIDSGNTAAPPLVSELSPALLGQRITVRGEILMFKCGPGISTEAGQAICLFEVPPAPGSADPYAAMLENIVDATGTLRFYSDPALANKPGLALYQRGHYYFEKGTIQLKHLNYVAPVAASLAGHQLSKSLVGKRITIRGKLVLFIFQCGPGIELDDGGSVCIETMHSNPFPGMFGKRVEATGTLRFFHDSTPYDENLLPQRMQDHYYFEGETTRVRLVRN